MLAAEPRARADLPDGPHPQARRRRRSPFEVSSRGVTSQRGVRRDPRRRPRHQRAGAPGAELRTSEERYRFLVENSPDVVFATDGEGNFTYLSETIEEMVGYPPGELVGGHFSRIVDERTLPTAFDRWEALIAEPDRVQVARLNLVHRDGRLVPAEVTSLGTTVDGEFAGIHGSTRDVSERERLEHDLRRQAGELASSQERAHLARELHDSVTQALFSMTLVTRTTELLVDRDTDKAKEQLGLAARPPARGARRDAGADLRAAARQPRAGRPAAGPQDPRRRAPGPHRPADRRHERPRRAPAARASRRSCTGSARRRSTTSSSTPRRAR